MFQSEGEAFAFPFPPPDFDPLRDHSIRGDSCYNTTTTNGGGNGANNNHTLGFISDILDGVVFTPLDGSVISSNSVQVVIAPSSSTSRPSPGTARCRSNLSSFRPPAAPAIPSSLNSSDQQQQQQSQDRHRFHHNSSTLVIATNPLTTTNKQQQQQQLNADLESLFQQELAAKIKKRSQGQQQQKRLSVSTTSATSSTRSHQQSAPLPPIPQETSLEEEAAAAEQAQQLDAQIAQANNYCTDEYDNPLYQTLEDCLSGGHHHQQPLSGNDDDYDAEDNYASVAYNRKEEEESSHYQTLPSLAIVADSNVKSSSERVYAQVDTLEDQKFYANCQELVHHVVQFHNLNQEEEEEGNSIYENVEIESSPSSLLVHSINANQLDQTYANVEITPEIITTPSSSSSESENGSNVLIALVLDVDSAATAASTNRCSNSNNSSSSGNSSTSPALTSSSEQLSPTDSLANGCAGRSIAGSPDSGIFGLLKPANASANANDGETKCDQSTATSLIIEIKSMAQSESEQQMLIDQTLKQFEKLEEELGSNESVPLKMEMPIPIETLLDLAGPIEPSEVVIDTKDGDDDGGEMESIPPQMPMSPPPLQPKVAPRSSSLIQRDTGDEADSNQSRQDDGIDLFQASFVNVDSQASSLTDTNDDRPQHSGRFMSPEPSNVSRSHNLGAKIVEDELKKQKEKDRARNEKLGLEDVGDSFEKLSMTRYDIISEMTPKKYKTASSGAFSPPTSYEGGSTELNFSSEDGVFKKPGLN